MSSHVSNVASDLFATPPSSPLYHYTSIDAVLKIVPDAALWATEIHYFNDSSELAHAVEFFVREARTLRDAAAYENDMLSQLIDWLRGRLAHGNMLFVTCFSEEGNLLSQWRGYTPHAQGVSLGFSDEHLLACVGWQRFELGQCIYDCDSKRRIASATVRAIAECAVAVGPSADAHPSQSFHPAFAAVEPDLLRISALLKHEAFKAEREWRAVSSAVTNYIADDIQYRAGRSTLVPHIPFILSLASDTGVPLERVYLGPSPETNLAMSALSGFLGKNKAAPKCRIVSSGIPYRET